MTVFPFIGKVSLRPLVALTFVTSISAQITWTQFGTSFNLYSSSGRGGCDRNAPNGVGMRDHVLTSLDDAWTISSTVIDDLPTASFSFNRDTRGLLFLLFGITWTAYFDPNPNDGSDAKYKYILDTFTKIYQLKTHPAEVNSPFYPKARFKCLEDYATYYQHLPGNDGLENKTAALAAQHYDVKMSNGNYFSGLMYVNNEAITQHDFSTGFYEPQEDDPSNGGCGNIGQYPAQAFTCASGGGSIDAIYGITVCPAFFERPTTSSLGTPAANGGTAEIDRFRDTGGIMTLHEMVHLVTLNEVIDQHAAYPPDGVTWTNRDWARWYLNTMVVSYGYTLAAYLGLSMPALALYNADNYAILATCMQYDELDCLGTFQSDIVAKRKLPFRLPSTSHRTVEKIRSGDLDLRKDDVPTSDVSGGLESLWQSEAEGGDGLGVGNSVGQNGKHPSRFKDV